MASLRVRRIDDELYQRLRIRAAEHGVSMEEEVRLILKRAVAPPERIGDLALEYFGDNGVELTLPPRVPHAPIPRHSEINEKLARAILRRAQKGK